jgi:Ca2+-transporting ATPase
MLVGLAGLGAYLAGRELDGDPAQTMAFATIALAELAFVFSIRSGQEPAWREPRNRYLNGGVVLSALLVGLVVYVPVLHEPFGTETLEPPALAIVLMLALVPFVLIEVAKAAKRATSGPLRNH